MEFVKRPGFIRLMNALKPAQPFQILIMSEESRLGREQIKTAYALQQLTDAGVQVWFYLSNQERKLDTAMDKIMGSLTGFASEIEREQAQQRTYDAMMRKAKAGHLTGGSVFGYDNIDIVGTTPDAKVARSGPMSSFGSTRRRPGSSARCSGSMRRATASRASPRR